MTKIFNVCVSLSTKTQTINRSRRNVRKELSMTSPWHPEQWLLDALSRDIRKFCRDPIRGFEKLRNVKLTATAAECDVSAYISYITRRRGRLMNPGHRVMFARNAREQKVSPSRRDSVVAQYRIYKNVEVQKESRSTRIIEFDVLTAMQWPPPRPLSARRVSLPRCRRRGLRRWWGLNERAGYRCYRSWCWPLRRDRNHRVWPRDSHVSIGVTRIRSPNWRQKESLRFTAPHAYARVNVRRRAFSSRPDTARIRETRRRKVFFRARRGPPNRCVMLHFPPVFFDSADVLATSAIPQRVGVLGNLASGGIFEWTFLRFDDVLDATLAKYNNLFKMLIIRLFNDSPS